MPSPGPSRTKLKNAEIATLTAALPKMPKEVLVQLVANGAPMTAEPIAETTSALKMALIERALGGELSYCLGYSRGEAKPALTTNYRHGSRPKSVQPDDGPVRIKVPRDRDRLFEPLVIPKYKRRFTGFDDKIVAIYARGLAVREIRGVLAEQYSCAVSAGFISSVTAAVMAPTQAQETTWWRERQTWNQATALPLSLLATIQGAGT